MPVAFARFDDADAPRPRRARAEGRDRSRARGECSRPSPSPTRATPAGLAATSADSSAGRESVFAKQILDLALLPRESVRCAAVD